MKIEQQVVSLELAKKLKEAGYPQGDSLWYWVEQLERDGFGRSGLKFLEGKWEITNSVGRFASTYNFRPNYAAPTVAELGEELLPISICEEDEKPITTRRIMGDCPWIVQRKRNMGRANNEADARAELWLKQRRKNERTIHGRTQRPR